MVYTVVPDLNSTAIELKLLNCLWSTMVGLNTVKDGCGAGSACDVFREDGEKSRNRLRLFQANGFNA